MVGALVLGAGIVVAALTEGAAFTMLTSGKRLMTVTEFAALAMAAALANALVWVGAELRR